MSVDLSNLESVRVNITVRRFKAIFPLTGEQRQMNFFFKNPMIGRDCRRLRTSTFATATDTVWRYVFCGLEPIVGALNF